MASLVRIEEVNGREYAGRILRMDAVCFPDDDRPDDDDLDSDLWWFAIGPRRVVMGHAAMTHQGYLSRAGVLPKYRGKGLQRRLIEARVWAARDLKLRRVTSVTAVFNVNSSNNLIACGFTTYLPKGDPGNTPFIHWKKDIN